MLNKNHILLLRTDLDTNTVLFIETINAEIAKLPRDLFRTQSNIKYGVFRENSYQFSAVNFFCRELHLRYLTVFQMDSVTIKAAIIKGEPSAQLKIIDEICETNF